MISWCHKYIVPVWHEPLGMKPMYLQFAYCKGVVETALVWCGKLLFFPSLFCVTIAVAIASYLWWVEPPWNPTTGMHWWGSTRPCGPFTSRIMDNRNCLSPFACNVLTCQRHYVWVVILFGQFLLCDVGASLYMNWRFVYVVLKLKVFIFVHPVNM